MPPPRTLDELYSLVSLSIHRAESAEAQGDVSLAAATSLDVSCLEEEIAELLPADDAEGAIARRGVVTAALSARQYARAVEMAAKYLSDHRVGGPLRAKLEELRVTAQREIDALSAVSDAFDPSARFRIAA
jgi:hypothetical protein